MCSYRREILLMMDIEEPDEGLKEFEDDDPDAEFNP